VATQIFRYDAYSVTQTLTSKPLILFAAPAPEIDQWVGVPQRGRLDDGETVGFQRQENKSRVRELAGFFDEQRNVVQNPLLAALQDSKAIQFISENGSPFGTLEITAEVLGELSLLELIQRVIARLEDRVPGLKDQAQDEDRRTRLIQRASELHEFDSDSDEDGFYDDDLAEDAVDEDGEDSSDVGAALLTEETQLIDFYQELSIRAEILGKLSDNRGLDELLGFSKDAMVGYLQPVVLVDGQHRLRGAVLSAKQATDSESGREQVRSAIDVGGSAAEAHRLVMLQNARRLPMSLLMDDSPSEHVFQFVVVNQKATPMSSALLGTIVSTSLSREELEPVATRLTNAGIKLEDSQAVAFLTRSPESPFRGCVQTGIAGDDSGLLPWSVLNALTSIFRELKGGKLYHQKNDYAAKWRRGYFKDSDLVSEKDSETEKFQAWSAPDGPWRPVFIRFFTLIRDKFGSDDSGSNNYWGNTRSNLFNKISLTILAADFFQYLDERRLTINSVADLDVLFSDWVGEVSDQYFSRDWRMNGLKKDQAPVQKKWAELWFEYRKDPEKLPRVDSFRP
jgi:hypothetical protein